MQSLSRIGLFSIWLLFLVCIQIAHTIDTQTHIYQQRTSQLCCDFCTAYSKFCLHIVFTDCCATILSYSPHSCIVRFISVPLSWTMAFSCCLHAENHHFKIRLVILWAIVQYSNKMKHQFKLHQIARINQPLLSVKLMSNIAFELNLFDCPYRKPAYNQHLLLYVYSMLNVSKLPVLSYMPETDSDWQLH